MRKIVIAIMILISVIVAALILTPILDHFLPRLGRHHGAFSRATSNGVLALAIISVVMIFIVLRKQR